MPNPHGIAQIQCRDQIGQVVSVCVYVIAVPCLVGAIVAAPVVRDESVARLPQEQHRPRRRRLATPWLKAIGRP
jgi:hypothetical protein